MRFIVGYPLNQNDNFICDIINNQEHISEVYFSWPEMPNGRSSLDVSGELTAFERQCKLTDDLKRLTENKIKLNILFNANCYGKESQSRAFFTRIGNLLDYIASKFGLNSATTSSPLIAKFIKENFDGIDVRASVNMEIGSIEGISYLSEYFDSFYVKRETNRDLPTLLRLRKWCDSNGKQMYLLANSGCLNNCSAHIFHDNLVAHEAEISAMDNGYQFGGICWEYLKAKDNFYNWLSRTNFIRPEDMKLYEELVPAVKLATRTNSAPSRILRSYIEGHYRGSAMELLEPNHNGLFYPRFVENSLIDKSFASHVMSCDKQCEKCTYCADVMRRACIKLDGDPSIKV